MLNFLGIISYQHKHANYVHASALFSSKGQLLEGDVKGQYTFKKFGLVADYDFLDQSVDSRLKNDLETIDMTFCIIF